MTNEEAINILKQRQSCMECVADCKCEDCDKAFEMAIESLENQKTLQAEFEEIENPCIECGGNCCFHEEEGCECQKIYVRKGVKQ